MQNNLQWFLLSPTDKHNEQHHTTHTHTHTWPPNATYHDHHKCENAEFRDHVCVDSRQRHTPFLAMLTQSQTALITILCTHTHFSDTHRTYHTANTVNMVTYDDSSHMPFTAHDKLEHTAYVMICIENWVHVEWYKIFVWKTMIHLIDPSWPILITKPSLSCCTYRVRARV